MAPRPKTEQGETDWENRVAERLTELRKKKYDSQEAFREALAEAGLEVTRGTIGHWESGQRRPTLSDLPKIAAALGVSVRSVLPKE